MALMIQKWIKESATLMYLVITLEIIKQVLRGISKKKLKHKQIIMVLRSTQKRITGNGD
jgi:hypothetical protein